MRILKAVSKKVSVVNIELSLKFGWLSERQGNFLNLLQKEGVPRKCVCVWGGGGEFSQKRGAPTLEETMNL